MEASNWQMKGKVADAQTYQWQTGTANPGDASSSVNLDCERFQVEAC